MKIYTGTCSGKKLEIMRKHNIGMMISPSPTYKLSKKDDYTGIRCALDNGAFRCHQRGYPFNEKLFYETLDECYSLKIDLDFIVCPDIVQGGEKSLDFSVEWARTKLKTVRNLALVVQDGMTVQMVDAYVLSLFHIIFIGGSVEWKWETADVWTKFAHKNNKKVHIGQVGQLRYLKFAEHIGVDSVDSTSFVRNDSWNVIKKFRKEIGHKGLLD
jgi:hypothetical protein